MDTKKNEIGAWATYENSKAIDEFILFINEENNRSKAKIRMLNRVRKILIIILLIEIAAIIVKQMYWGVN